MIVFVHLLQVLCTEGVNPQPVAVLTTRTTLPSKFLIEISFHFCILYALIIKTHCLPSFLFSKLSRPARRSCRPRADFHIFAHTDKEASSAPPHGYARGAMIVHEAVPFMIIVRPVSFLYLILCNYIVRNLICQRFFVIFKKK